jgi:hypothetical protein
LIEALAWQHLPTPLLWQKLKERLSAGLIFGPIVGVIFGLIFGLSDGLNAGLSVGLILGLSSGLFVTLDAFVQYSEMNQRIQPNQGIWISWHNAQRTGLIYGLIFGLVFWLNGQLIFGLVFGLISGLIFYGGQAVIKHYVLRWLLARQGVLPFPFQDRKLIAYLDEMAARLLLRRVGGGWIFIHRTLLEFLADEGEFEKLMKDLGGG